MKSRKLILKVLLSVALIIMVLNLSCTIAAGGRHTVGIRPDGTVVATGNNDDGQCNVAGWTDIVHVAAGFSHTVGLEEGGTVVATGNNDDGQCNVAGWTDISMVVAGDWHTVGLKNDGSVVATGKSDQGQCDILGWADIQQVAAGGAHTVGLESGGTVVATGNNDDGQCNVGGWTDISMVVAGYAHTVGLKSDGTVVATGNNAEGQCNVAGWTDIQQVAAGRAHTVGLKSDGTVVATGNNDEGQCDVGSWILETLSSEPPGSYHLTISSAAGGLVTAPGEGTFAYCESEAVNLVAEADACYEFVDWTGDVGTIGNVNAASTNITMDGDYFITANFAKISYDLTTDSTAGGSVTTPGEGTFPYDCGTVVNLVAEAEEGYRFVNWTGDIATIADVENATITITMNDNYSVTANFEEKPSIINWPLIAGIIGAVVVVGLVIFFVRRR
jgi:uncharacterized repeat protein (TIGR02543 family)